MNIKSIENQEQIETVFNSLTDSIGWLVRNSKEIENQLSVDRERYKAAIREAILDLSTVLFS